MFEGKVADIKLGTHICSQIDGLSHDILRKRTSYIQRNNEIIQEPCKTHPRLRCRINSLLIQFSMQLKFGTSLVNQMSLCPTRGMCLFGKCSNYRLRHIPYYPQISRGTDFRAEVREN